MGKRVRAALHAARVAAETPTASAEDKQYFTNLMDSFNAAEQTKTKGFFRRLGAKTKNSILNPKILIKDVGDTARAGLKGGVDKRALLRGHHEKTIHPFQTTAQNLVKSERMLRSGDPAEVAAGVELKAIADRRSLRNAKTGAAVGVAFIGASAAIGGSGTVAGGSVTGGQTVGQVAGKLVGTYGARAVAASRAKKEELTGGLADTAIENGDGMDPATRANYNDYMSNAAKKFFGMGGATATGGGAASCAAAGGGDPWLFCIGFALFAVSLFVRMIPWRK